MTRRFPLPFRLMCWLFGVAGLVVALVVPLIVLANRELVLLILVPSFAGGGWFFVRMARVRMVATDTGVRILNPFRSYDLPWSEIIGVLPTREGLALGLADGGNIVVWATCKSSLPGTIRVDAEAYAYIRERIDRELRRLATEEGLLQ